MPVRIAKPEVNIREKLAELERPIGLNGSALMRTETPQEAFSLIGAGRRNLIINGDFKISQRGNYTSPTALSSSIYTLDRWYTLWGGGGTIQHKKNQVLPNGSITDTVLATATSVGYVGFEQFIEFPEIYSGQTFTVSFWIKTNYHLTEVNVYNGSVFSLQGSAGGRLNETSGQWKYVSKTFTMPTSGNSVFRIEIWTGTGSTPIGSYIELAQVQVEEGKVATPFEYRSFGEELALCQRYYEKSHDLSITPADGATSDTRKGVAVIFNGTDFNTQFYTFSVRKRATPSITFYRPNFINGTGVWAVYQNGNNWADRPISSSWANEHGFVANGSVTSGTSAQAVLISGQWAASAEL